MKNSIKAKNCKFFVCCFFSKFTFSECFPPTAFVLPNSKALTSAVKAMKTNHAKDIEREISEEKNTLCLLDL